MMRIAYNSSTTNYLKLGWKEPRIIKKTQGQVSETGFYHSKKLKNQTKC